MRTYLHTALPMMLLAVTMLGATLATAPAGAANQPIPVFSTEVSRRGETNFTITRLKKLVEDSVQILLTISMVVVTGFVVYGGLQMAMSSGNTTKFDNGKKIVVSALIGGAVILGVGLIINTIAKFAREPSSVIQ